VCGCVIREVGKSGRTRRGKIRKGSSWEDERGWKKGKRGKEKGVILTWSVSDEERKGK